MWVVKYRYSGTGVIAAQNPTIYNNQEEANRYATEYNRYNQDFTWNCICAYVEESDFVRESGANNDDDVECLQRQGRSYRLRPSK